YPGNYAYLEIIWYFCGLNVWMMTVSVFAVMQRVKGTSGRWLSKLAGLTFGIYLCHFPFEYVAYDMLDFAVLPSWVRIFAGAFITFAMAVVVCRVLSIWRPTRHLIA
ncbi:MAG: acyltransferase family protein, partial [Paramuribaculum sp.]|nr:acyltransferase family protein [Paramuribaculum sp.]